MTGPGTPASGSAWHRAMMAEAMNTPVRITIERDLAVAMRDGVRLLSVRLQSIVAGYGGQSAWGAPQPLQNS